MPSSSPFIRAGVLKSSPIRLSRIEKEKTLKKFEERLTRLEEKFKETCNIFINKGLNSDVLRVIYLTKKDFEKDIDKIESKVQILMNQPVQSQDKPELELFSADDI